MSGKSGGSKWIQTTLISETLKHEMNGFEITQENCPSIMSILTQSEGIVLYEKVFYTLSEQLTICEIIQNYLSVFWGWCLDNFLRIISS